MGTLQRSDTVRFQTINSVLYKLEYKLLFYKVGFFSLLIFNCCDYFGICVLLFLR